MDMAAAATGIDRIEIRRQNLICPDDIPYENKFGLTYDSGDYPQALEEAVALSDWHGFEGRREDAAKRGKLRGIGIANYADLSTGYPREWTEIDVRPEGRECADRHHADGAGASDCIQPDGRGGTAGTVRDDRDQVR